MTTGDSEHLQNTARALIGELFSAFGGKAQLQQRLKTEDLDYSGDHGPLEWLQQWAQKSPFRWKPGRFEVYALALLLLMDEIPSECWICTLETDWHEKLDPALREAIVQRLLALSRNPHTALGFYALDVLWGLAVEDRTVADLVAREGLPNPGDPESMM